MKNSALRSPPPPATHCPIAPLSEILEKSQLGKKIGGIAAASISSTMQLQVAL
jgi:hypothetical protein